MSVTKSRKRKEGPLDLYVDLLNEDLSFDPRPKLKKGQKLKDFLDQFEREETLPDRFNLLTGEPRLKPDYSFLVFLFFKFCPFLAYIYFRFLWIEKAKNLQAEMRNDLFPIAARKEIPETLFPLFERWACLTEKLNEMGFIRRWDPHPPKNKKGRIIIRAWNFKPDYDQRDFWYMGLAERLEDGDLERLRLCPVCSKYFAARDRRQRFCSPSCKRKYDNKDSKLRQKKYRSKQKMNNEKERRNRSYEERIDGFCKFVKFAISHSQDIKDVGPMILRLGQGDGNEGWQIIERAEDRLKSAISPQQVFRELPQEIKNWF